MIVVVVLLAVACLAALAFAVVTRTALQRTRSELDEQRDATEQAAARATEHAEARDAARQEAEATAAARDEATVRADAEAARADVAEQRARQRLDPELLWTLELARSERTWRHSVAVGPDATSVFTGHDDPLRVALQVEVDAAREEVGAIVDLDIDLPSGAGPATAMLVLRTAQELLARSIKTADTTALGVAAGGAGIDVTVRPSNEDDTPAPPPALVLPSTDDVEPIEAGVRITHSAR